MTVDHDAIKARIAEARQLSNEGFSYQRAKRLAVLQSELADDAEKLLEESERQRENDSATLRQYLDNIVQLEERQQKLIEALSETTRFLYIYNRSNILDPDTKRANAAAREVVLKNASKLLAGTE